MVIPPERLVLQKIVTTLDALGEKYIASGCNCDDMGMLIEWLERDRVMDFSGCLPRVIELDEIVWEERFFGDRVCVVMLP